MIVTDNNKHCALRGCACIRKRNGVTREFLGSYK